MRECGVQKVTQPGHGELDFRVRAEMFEYRIFMGTSISCFIRMMGMMVLQGVVRKIPRAHPAVTSLNL